MAKSNKLKEVDVIVTNEQPIYNIDDFKVLLVPYIGRTLTFDELSAILNISDKVTLANITDTLSERTINVIRNVYYFEEHEGADLALIPSYIINNYFTNSYFYHPITKKHISSNNIDQHIIKQFEILPFN